MGPNVNSALSTVGTINGAALGLGGGPDIVYQNDTSETFFTTAPTVPTPTAPVAGLFAVGGMVWLGLRKLHRARA